jgi:hypothetical protein
MKESAMMQGLAGHYGMLLLRQSPGASFVVNLLCRWWMETIRRIDAFFGSLDGQSWLPYLSGKRIEVSALLASVQLQAVSELAMVTWFAVDWIFVHARFWMISMRTTNAKISG